MFYSKEMINILKQREINLKKFSSNINYENQIVKSFYNNDKLIRSKLLFNATNIEFCENGNYLVSASLGDDKKIKIFDIEKNFNFSLSEKENFDSKRKIVSYVHDLDFTKIFLKSYDNVAIVDIKKNDVMYSPYFSNLKNISVNPFNQNLLLVTSFDKLQSLDLRSFVCNKIQCYNENKICSAQYYLPKEYLILVATENNELFILDTRNNQPVFNYNLQENIFQKNFSDEICVKFNRKGDQFLVTKKHSNPLLFDPKKSEPIYEFFGYGYYNSVDSENYGCFAGPNDEYIVHGSDNFNIYLWEIPKHNQSLEFCGNQTKFVLSEKFVLKGHTMKPIKVCYNYKKSILASLGQEHEIFLWSIFPFKKNNNFEKTDFSNDTSDERTICTGTLNKNTKFYIRLRDLDLFRSIKNSSIKEIKYKFCFKKNENIVLEEYLKVFNCDPHVVFLKNIIQSYKDNSHKTRSSFLQIVDKFIEKELVEKSRDLHIQQVSIIIEIRKLFATKKILDSSFCYIRNQLKLSEDIEKKVLVQINEKRNMNSTKKLKVLMDIKLQMNLILNEIAIILDQNQYVYQKSICFIKLIFNRLYSDEKKQEIDEINSDFFEIMSYFPSIVFQ